MRTLMMLALLLASGSAFAATQCTTADRSTWQDPDKFQAQLKEQGYKINKFLCFQQFRGGFMYTSVDI